MFTTLVSVQSLLLGMGILLAGSGLLSTLLGLRAHMAGFSDLVIGLIMSAFYVGYIIGTLWIPEIIRQVGHIRTFAAMAAISCAAAILHGLWVNPWGWLGLRLINGVSLLGLYIVTESWLNEQVNTHRGQVFGIYMMVTLVALGAGQFLIGIYGAQSSESFAIVALLFAVGLIPVALTRVAQPVPMDTTRLSLKDLYRLAPTGTLGSLLSGAITGALWGMAAVYGNRIGLSDHQVALFIALMIFGGAVLQWPLGRISDHYDRRLVLTLIAVGGAIASGLLIALPFLPASALWPVALLFGGFSFSLYAVSVAQTHDRLTSDQVLEGTRGLLMLNGAGAAMGPLLSGLLMGHVGANGFPGFVLFVLVMLAGLLLWHIRVDAPVPEEDRGEFVATTRTSAAAVELDPRSHEEDESETGEQEPASMEPPNPDFTAEALNDGPDRPDEEQPSPR